MFLQQVTSDFFSGVAASWFAMLVLFPRPIIFPGKSTFLNTTLTAFGIVVSLSLTVIFHSL